jgi:DNA-binding XRE family transcriptional regulator
MKIKMICEQCKEPAEIDKGKSNENWTVYIMNCKKCGAKIKPIFKMEVEDR